MNPFGSALTAERTEFHLHPARLDALCAHLSHRPGASEGVAALEDLFEAFCAGVLFGNTAKIDAVAAGATPSAAHVDEIADQVSGGSNTSWSCLATSAVFAATVNGTIPGAYGHVTLSKRTDPATAPVDVHAAVAVQLDGAGVWLCDPFHNAAPAQLGATPVPVTRGPTTATWEMHGAHWRSTIHGRRTNGAPYTLTYRGFAPTVDPATLEMVAVISTTHSGVGVQRAEAKLHPAGRTVRLLGDDTGVALHTLRVDDVETVEQPDWGTGIAALRAAAARRDAHS